MTSMIVFSENNLNYEWITMKNQVYLSIVLQKIGKTVSQILIHYKRYFLYFTVKTKDIFYS